MAGKSTGKAWQWYEARVAELMGKIPGAKVRRDAKEIGQDSKVQRQLDVLIQYPAEIDLGRGFKLTIPIKIIVDCKHYERRIDVKTVEDIAGLKDDVRAQMAIIVSPKGFSDGAMERAKALGVLPMVVTADLIAFMRRLSGRDFELCHICDGGGDDHPPAMVDWQGDVEGRCDWCNGLHVRCPDCGEVFGIGEEEYERPIKCPAGCEAMFFVEQGDYRDGENETLEVFDSLDSMLLTKALSKITKCLTPHEVDKLIAMTRWQHWGEGSPTINLTELGYMEYGENEQLCLTDEGTRWAELIQQAEFPTYY